MFIDIGQSGTFHSVDIDRSYKTIKEAYFTPCFSEMGSAMPGPLKFIT